MRRLKSHRKRRKRKRKVDEIATEISVPKFLNGVESGHIREIFFLTVGTEDRIYGKTVLGQGATEKRWKLVYAVMM